MIKVIINANGKSEPHVDGSSEVCLRESSIALLTICEALSETTDCQFDDIFEAVVASARMMKFFKDKERDYENRT